MLGIDFIIRQIIGFLPGMIPSIPERSGLLPVAIDPFAQVS